MSTMNTRIIIIRMMVRDKQEISLLNLKMKRTPLILSLTSRIPVATMLKTIQWTKLLTSESITCNSMNCKILNTMIHPGAIITKCKFQHQWTVQPISQHLEWSTTWTKMKLSRKKMEKLIKVVKDLLKICHLLNVFRESYLKWIISQEMSNKKCSQT